MPRSNEPARTLDGIAELIEEGERFTFENFSHKSARGFPNALSEDWIVWTHQVAELVGTIKSPTIAGPIEHGLNTKFLGNGEDRFDSAKMSILNGLKAAQKVYGAVPASDRIVSLGHNSPEQKQALEKLDELVAAIKETNDFPGEPEEKERVVAELSAGRWLLEAARVRASAVRETLGPPLRWIAEKASAAVIGKLAADLWQYLVHIHIFF